MKQTEDKQGKRASGKASGKSPRPPRGMRDFLAAQVMRRRRVISTIRSVYERYGFEPLETPAMEDLDVLMGKYGEEGDQLLFKVLKRGDKLRRVLAQGTGRDLAAADLADLGLRYDLTVPLARVVANHRAELSVPYKRYQIQPVWRADRPAKGRFREFYQCDVDVVGASGPLVEAELLGAAGEALAELGFADFRIRLNHRGLLFGLLDAAGLPSDRWMEAVVAVDKMDKIGPEGVAGQLEERGIVGAKALVDMLTSLSGPGDRTNEALLAALLERAGEPVRAGVEELSSIVSMCAAGPASGHLVVDPALARGLSYYTGAIFEIDSPDLSVSLAGGGRYDGLIGMFSGRDLPACGISLGLERILEIMESRGMFAGQDHGPQVLVTTWNQDLSAESLHLAAELRRAGLKVDLHPKPGKIGKQLKYAAGRDIPLAVILGPDEAAAGQVVLKDLRQGTQQTLSQADLPSAVRRLLSLGESESET